MKTDKMTAKELKGLRFPKGTTHIRVTNPKGNSVQEKKNASALAEVEGVFEFGTLDGKKFVPFVPGEAPVVAAPKAKAEKPAKAPKVKAEKTEKAEKADTDAPALGKCGGVLGFAVTAVIRALGKHGVTKAQVVAIMAAKKVEVSPTTVQIQVCAGKAGTRGEPAKLTKEQFAELLALAPEAIAA